MGTVKAVCVSEKKGVQKQNINSARFFPDWGMENDAHGGNWHRQVSLLSYDKVKRFNEQGANVKHGDFGENLVVEGIDFSTLRVGTRFRCGQAVLEMTQIGKECHTHCQIYHKMGDCIMPREGVFAKVIQEGVISVGDTMEVITPASPKFCAAVITISDTGFSGKREDKSGPLIASMLEEADYIVEEQQLLPDNHQQLIEALTNLADRRHIDLILTTGGTGFSRRDFTPEATLAVAERMAPGIAEGIRAHSMQITTRAMLGRGVAVIRGSTLIINLPGSPKAVRESLEYILPHLAHGLEVLRGNTSECADVDCHVVPPKRNSSQ
jgi:molybdenum cofactor synthesis domain-containing protein